MAELGLDAVENMSDADALDHARLKFEAILLFLDRLEAEATNDLVAKLGVVGIEPRRGRERLRRQGDVG